MSIDPADYWMTPAEERRLEDKLTVYDENMKTPNKPVSMHDLFDIKMPDDNIHRTDPSGSLCHTCKMWRPEHLSSYENDGFCGKHGFITRATEQCPEHVANH